MNALEMQMPNTTHETMAEAKSFELVLSIMNILEQTQERLSTDAKAEFVNTKSHYGKRE